MKTVADLVRGWLAKGDSDLAEASRCAQSAGPYDTGCFHCQQAVEKYAKAVFDLRAQLPPRTHDLGRLLTALQAIESSLGALARPEVVQLTDYAVKLRYDSDFWPTQVELAEALAVAHRVRAEILLVISPEMHPLSKP